MTRSTAVHARGLWLLATVAEKLGGWGNLFSWIRLWYGDLRCRGGVSPRFNPWYGR